MKATHLLAITALGAALVTALPAQAQSTQYQLFDLGQLTSGDLMYVTGLNNSGQVTGYAYTAGYNGWSSTDDYRAFVTGADGGGLSALGTLGGSWSKAAAINDAGLVAGSSQTAGGGYRAFLGGTGHATLQDLGTLAGSTNSAAVAINASGQVIGTASVDSASGPPFQDNVRGFITGANGQAMQGLGTLNNVALVGRAINDQGRVAGHVGDSLLNQQGAFVTAANGSAPHSLPADVIDATAINNAGQVAGNASGRLGVESSDAFLGIGSTGAQLLDFQGVPNWNGGYLGGSGQYGPAGASQAFDVNELGQVAGSFANHRQQRSYAFITGANGQGVINVNSLFTLPDGDYFSSVTGINDEGQFVVNTGYGHAYLISPVPEPATAALWLAGLLLVGRLLRKPRAEPGLSVPACA